MLTNSGIGVHLILPTAVTSAVHLVLLPKWSRVHPKQKQHGASMGRTWSPNGTQTDKHGTETQTRSPTVTEMSMTCQRRRG